MSATNVSYQQEVDVADLSPEATRVLRILDERGIVRGATLMKLLSIKRPEALKEAVLPLVTSGLIEVSGDVHDEKEIRYTSFFTRPSMQSRVHSVVKKSLLAQ